MEKLNIIIGTAIDYGATDIHLAMGSKPVYRIDRNLKYDDSQLEMSQEDLNEIFDTLISKSRIKNLREIYESNKHVDFSYEYIGYRLRVNVSASKGVPTFSMRIIPNQEIDIDKLGLRDIINRIKKVKSGLVLITGKVNSGKSTTLNAYVQEINKEESKKIVTLEDPIEYIHKSDKSIVIQKEIGSEADIVNYKDGLINLLREDADIAVLGEIRDKDTMDVALDLAESGGLIIGTLHTRSCGETIERIINMYEKADQASVKNTLSVILKLVVSEKLLQGKDGELVLIPEIMSVNSTLAAQIRQEKFNVSEIEDSIHTQRSFGCKSFEVAFSEMYLKGKIGMKEIRASLEPEKIDVVKSLIISNGGSVIDDID